MYQSLRGKKLLVIGSSEVDASIVSAAHDLGVYVICTDGLPKSAGTFAKNIADESWDIDYSHTEEIGERCLKAHVDGVLAGYSEFRVSAACKIARYIGTPFYATEEQIELTRNKQLFKNTCRKYGVSVPADYSANVTAEGEAQAPIRYPVIVKPTDSAGRKGVTVCDNPLQLKEAVKRAIRYSASSTFIVEEYIEGMEFVAVYTIKDGKYSLSCFNEKYLNQECKSSGLCDLALTPSKHMKLYLERTDSGVRHFLKGIGAQNGVAFFQGIAARDDCYVFEMGYRLNGGNDYFIAERENGISYLKMLIAHSLTGVMEGNLELDNPDFSRYYANYLLYGHAGKIGTIRFFGDTEHSGLEDIHIKKAPGMMIQEDSSTQQCVFTFKLSSESVNGIAELVKYCQQHAELKNENGENMLFQDFDTSVLLKKQGGQ